VTCEGDMRWPMGLRSCELHIFVSFLVAESDHLLCSNCTVSVRVHILVNFILIFHNAILSVAGVSIDNEIPVDVYERSCIMLSRKKKGR
jgi:hypothetical protein